MSVEALTPFPSQLPQQSVQSPPPSLTRPHLPARAWTVSGSTPSSSGQLRSILLKDPPPRLEIQVSSVDSLPPSTDAQNRPSDPEQDLISPESSSNRTSSASFSSSDVSAETSTSLATPSSSNSSTCTSLTRTRTDTLASNSPSSSTTPSPSITFAPLPKLAPRKRNSSRPLGIAARGQILRQRRAMMTQDVTTYYIHDQEDPNVVSKAMEEANSIPGGFRIVVTPEQAEQMRARAAMQAHARAKLQQEEAMKEEVDRDEKVAEDPIIALGRLLNDATKVLWRRVSSSKNKETPPAEATTVTQGSSKAEPDSDKSECTEQRPAPPRRGKSWPSRLRSASIYDPPSSTSILPSSSSSRRIASAGKGSNKTEADAGSDSDSVDELWKKEGAEDPMTRTIVEGSDEENGFEHYVEAPEVDGEGEGLDAADVEDETVALGNVEVKDGEDNQSIADVALQAIEIGRAC